MARSRSMPKAGWSPRTVCPWPTASPLPPTPSASASPPRAPCPPSSPAASNPTLAPSAIGASTGPGGPVPPIIPGSAQPQPLGNLAMASFINPAGLEPIGQNLFKESAASGQPQQGIPGSNGLGVIKQGFLEASNINIVEELVTMIQTQRAYEMNSKAIQTSDQMLAKLSQL